MILAPAFVVAAAVVGAGWLVAAELRAGRQAAAREGAARILAMLAPGIVAAAQDPRALPVWQQIAETARRLSPAEFVELDRASGSVFPFGSEAVQAAHARWTTDWLAWEGAHDVEYKLKAALAQAELLAADDAGQGSAPLARARLAAIEQEKLDRYQRRYEEYTRVSRALQTLLARAS